MKNKTIFGIIAGVTASVMAGTAVALTTKKIVREIKRELYILMQEPNFICRNT